MHPQLMYTPDTACAKLEGRTLVILFTARLNQFREAFSLVELFTLSYAGFRGL